MYHIKMTETLHCQSGEAWKKRSAEMESSNKNYLIRINNLFHEKDDLELPLKSERNTDTIGCCLTLKGE